MIVIKAYYSLRYQHKICFKTKVYTGTRIYRNCSSQYNQLDYASLTHFYVQYIWRWFYALSVQGVLHKF